MITDRIQLTGLDSYFQDPANSGRINLGGITPTIRTAPLNKGKQLEISGIQLMIEHIDLQPLMKFQFDNRNPPQPAPLFKVSVMKEMFSGLFADPFSHRVHNIAGFLDFNEGTLINGRVMEIDGISTIVSTGRDECVWVSKEYEMPDPISIDAIAWELATAKQIPPDSFHYQIKITSKDEQQVDLPVIFINTVDGNLNPVNDPAQAQPLLMLNADVKRAVDGLNNPNIKSFQITFTAKVFEDSFLSERHLPTIRENIGRPLLRAINIVEPVKSSIYEIHSLVELQNLCSDFHLSETPGPEIRRLTATLNISATLVNSPNENIASSKFEFIELSILRNDFTYFEAKILGENLIKLSV